MSQERSAEWLRGKCEAAKEVHQSICQAAVHTEEAMGLTYTWSDAVGSVSDYEDHHRALLAEAEAREAPEVIPGTREALAGLTIRPQAPTAADLAVADELDRLAEHVQTLPPDDYRDDIKRICHNRAKDLRRGVKRAPTSEQVIAAAERALEPICKNANEAERMLNEGWVEKHQHIANKLQFGDVVAAKEALSLIAKYKEGK